MECCARDNSDKSCASPAGVLSQPPSTDGSPPSSGDCTPPTPARSSPEKTLDLLTAVKAAVHAHREQHCATSAGDSTASDSCQLRSRSRSRSRSLQVSLAGSQPSGQRQSGDLPIGPQSVSPDAAELCRSLRRAQAALLATAWSGSARLPAELRQQANVHARVSHSTCCMPSNAAAVAAAAQQRSAQCQKVAPEPACQSISVQAAAGSAARASVRAAMQSRAAFASRRAAPSDACPQPKKKKTLLQKIGGIGKAFVYSLCIYPRQWDGSVEYYSGAVNTTTTQSRTIMC